MHPAKSVIFFTTFSGAGFGLIGLLSLAISFGYVSLNPALMITAIAGVLLSVAGLISSTFHLGNPQRAWRALSQWRSSWLSREGVLSIVSLGGFVLWIAYLYRYGSGQLWAGFVIALLCGVTIFATAMIYAQLKPVPRWHSQLTPACYLGFSLSSGMILLMLALPQNKLAILVSIVCVILAWLIKFSWWKRADGVHRNKDGSTTATATGLTGYAEVRLFEAPHSTQNYLMKEMVFELGRRHAGKLRMLAVGIGGVGPVCFCLLAFIIEGGYIPLFILAAIFHIGGLFIERWLFFAEAEHVVALYYGKT